MQSPFCQLFVKGSRHHKPVAGQELATKVVRPNLPPREEIPSSNVTPTLNPPLTAPAIIPAKHPHLHIFSPKTINIANRNNLSAGRPAIHRY
jgi:hypothetical protein